MPGLFITATDTGVGKTEITAGIARTWRAQGRSFAVCKPVATGASLHQGRLRAEDTLRLSRAAGDSDLDAITPLVFEPAAAPCVAARLMGQTLTLEQVIAGVRHRQAQVEKLLVEGVGGLLCPLTEDSTIADLVQAVRIPLVVVARRCLGTLNHTLLTLEVARTRGLEVVGVVVSETTPVAGVADETNVEELRSRIGVPVLAVVPFKSGGYEEEITELARVDWWSRAR